MNKPYIRQIFSYSMVGSLGLTIVAALHGCGGDQPPAEPNKAQTPGAISEAAKGEGVFMVIQQTGANPDTYELKEKYPSSEGTRAILKGMDGKERILNEDELKKIADAEAKKVEAGTSALTKEPAAQSAGLSLGETILASAAGALVGGMIANKLMGNSNYQQHQQYQQQHARTNPPSSYQSRPAGGMGGAPSTSSQPKSGFFGSSSGSRPSGSTGSSSFGGGSFGG